MVHFSIISATAGILAAASLVSATPVPSNNEPKARIIPFVNKHAAARRSESYNFSETTKKDLHRIQRRNERDAAFMKRSGTETLRVKRTAAALEPFDIDSARKARTKKRQGVSSTDPLVNNSDGLYYGNITIGNPAQITTIDFDTGSSDLIVPSTACGNCTGPFFDPSKSTSFVTTNQPFTIAFGDGSSAGGVLSTEIVAIGNLAVQNQPFAVITQASKGFDGPNAGLMGLAFPTLAQTGATPWFMELANQGALASNVVSFYLSRQGAEGSELCVGCIDGAKFTGQPEYFPLTPGNASQTYWNIQTQGFTYNGQIVTQAMTATIDSGTSLIYLPPSACTALYSKIPGAQAAADKQHFTFPCANAASLGTIGMVFANSNTVFNINPTQFNAGVMDQAAGLCAGAVVSSGVENGAALVGDAFMSTWYSIFDYGNMRVGFAQAV